MSNHYEIVESKVKDNIDSIITIYFKDFLNKFESRL